MTKLFIVQFLNCLYELYVNLYSWYLHVQRAYIYILNGENSEVRPLSISQRVFTDIIIDEYCTHIYAV